MEKNKIYIGKIHNEPVRYLGLEYHEELEVNLHQFEFVIFRDNIRGYGQNQEQVNLDQYELLKIGTLLYGR